MPCDDRVIEQGGGRSGDPFAYQTGTSPIEALFSVIYAKEKNCTSGIAMFIVPEFGCFKRADSRTLCHY